MLRICCLWCGVRDEDEFTYGGAWDRERPTDPRPLSDEEWAAYLYTRENARGATLERWRHSYGCRQWMILERDTMTHRIARVLPLAEAPRRSRTEARTPAQELQA